MTKKSFERYGKFDSLGRCTMAFANVSKSTMPKTARGSIGMIKPTGWHTVRYSNVPGGYLYNRCHLIAYELTAENANPRNLITGTRYLNIEGMLPFENQVADYVKETGHHVLYRVKPKFKDSNLLARPSRSRITGVGSASMSIVITGSRESKSTMPMEIHRRLAVDPVAVQVRLRTNSILVVIRDLGNQPMSISAVLGRSSTGIPVELCRSPKLPEA